MDVRLEVVHEKTRVRHVRLRRDTVVGRGKDCQLRIPVADVSRRHCQFTLEGERLLVEDLGSSNGTQIGNRTIPTGKAILLADGDTVTVGPVSFILHLSTTDDVTPASDQHSPLQDTAEFPSIDPITSAEADFVSDDRPADSPPATAGDALSTSSITAPPPPAEDQAAPVATYDDSVIDDDDDPVSTDEASVVELELSSSVDVEGRDDDQPTAELEVHDPPEKPLKSRSLFGLFRRHTASADDAGVADDDLMEEPGEDPPATPDADTVSDGLHDGAIAAGHPAALHSKNTDPASGEPPAESSPGNSVFDDVGPAEEPLEIVDQEEIEEIAEDGDAISFDFLGDESSGNNDDVLDDFLGQFGD